MWQRLERVYDHLSERQRLAIGVVGVFMAAMISVGIVVCVVIGVVRLVLSK